MSYTSQRPGPLTVRQYLAESERIALAHEGRNVWGVPFTTLAGIQCGCGCGSWDVPSCYGFTLACLDRINRRAVRS